MSLTEQDEEFKPPEAPVLPPKFAASGVQFCMHKVPQKEVNFRLHAAINEGNLDLVSKYLQEGANINCMIYFTTPLCLSIYRYPQIAIFLVNNGANVNLSDASKQLMKPLHYATRMKPSSLVLNLIQILIEHQADVNGLDRLRSTPLHWACYRGNFETVQLLLSAKAALNLPDHCNKRPIHRAVESESVDCVKALLEAGCDVNVTDSQGWSPLFNAVVLKNVEITRILIQFGANLKIRDNNGDSLLHILASNNRAKVATAIIRTGIHVAYLQVHASNPFSYRVLHKKSESQIQELCKILLDVGLSPYQVNTSNETSLDLCLESQEYSVLLLMLLYGAKLTSNLNEAIQSPYKKMINFLFENQVLTLQSLCRIVIRKQIGLNTDDKLMFLNLPTSLANYLTFKDLK